MDFMGQVEKTVAHAKKKANELKEISKIKYGVYDLGQDVKKLYAEIGKKVYENLRNDSTLPEDIKMKCDILEAKLAKIESLRAKESYVKNNPEGIYCPSCGRFCDLGVNFCPSCGTELAETVEAEVNTEAEEESTQNQPSSVEANTAEES